MFQKEFRIKSSAALKGAEQKKLKSQILKSFNVTENLLEDFLSKQLTQMKIITHNNVIMKLYCVQDVAILFELKGKLYPSLFMVWNFPNIVPRVKLNENTTINFAVSPELNYNSIISNEQMLRSLPVEQCISIYSSQQKKVIAVGCTMTEVSQIEDLDNTYINVLHHYEDVLFQSYVKKIIPKTVNAMEEEFKNTFSLNDVSSNDQKQPSTEKMDETIIACSLNALKNSVTKEMLPLLASTFYKKFVIPLSPEEFELDIKKTSYKKLSTFLQSLDEQRIIKFTVGKDGIAEITHINYSNSKLEEIDSQTSENPNAYSPPVKETYVVTPGLHPLFSEFLCRKGDELSVPSVRRYVTEYVKKHSLQDATDPSKIKTNEVLQKILSQRKDKLLISFKDLIDEIIKLMHRTEISCLNTDSKKALKKKINTIDIAVNNRSGNKKVTLVNNLEMYGVDLTKFSKECQHGVAASTTINDVPNAQNRQVQIQGCQVPFVFKLLTDQYKIPAKYLRGHESYINKKAKK
ncbi:eukaryotic translation initiation factor 2D-like [Adelges cooleyi]|uniref:eukaryotic translation initiation factor 2D-like n=1 Tax=Adelges cooleyi TaxID=133065 RepID=UPI0021805701|nr:eukaryotic translation initiation factor 2D-like [Adelges cooleyi]XP_050426020.1 eukaryotic translation initiation factor 2D-like [Adelges cooleyi]XP_050426021.1 eukaryotic translation initiation factor 2D-like [Adelges cooleyi]